MAKPQTKEEWIVVLGLIRHIRAATAEERAEMLALLDAHYPSHTVSDEEKGEPKYAS